MLAESLDTLTCNISSGSALEKSLSADIDLTHAETKCVGYKGVETNIYLSRHSPLFAELMVLS